MKAFLFPLVLALLRVQAGQAGDLILNGSFEQPDVPATPGHVNVAVGSYLPVAPNASLIPAWQVSGAAVAVTHTPYNEGLETVLSGDGLQSVDLTGTTFNGLGAVEQTAATTPGRDYALTFQLGIVPGSPAYSGPIRVRVSASATVVEFRHDAPAPASAPVWQAFALPFRATAASTTVRFENVQAAHWSGLDRVALADAHLGPAPTGLSLPWWTADGGGWRKPEQQSPVFPRRHQRAAGRRFHAQHPVHHRERFLGTSPAPAHCARRRLRSGEMGFRFGRRAIGDDGCAAQRPRRDLVDARITGRQHRQRAVSRVQCSAISPDTRELSARALPAR